MDGSPRKMSELPQTSSMLPSRSGPNLTAMQDFTKSAQALRELLSQRILVLDGAMGTMLQQRDLTAADLAAQSWKVATRTWCVRGRM